MSTTSPTPPGPPEARDRVKLPAMLLMATAGLTGAVQMAIVIVNVILKSAYPLGINVGNMTTGILGRDVTLPGWLLGSVGVLTAAFVVYGALCMMRLRSYGHALAASIVIMVPIVSPCCLLGLPAGIWAILVLRAPEVKAAFTNA